MGTNSYFKLEFHKTRLTIILILLALCIVSCSSETDIYKTKSGEFASKSGNFIAKFPTQPKFSTIENQLGLDKFNIDIYRSGLGSQKIFIVEVTNYPEHLLTSKTDKEILTESLTNLTNRLGKKASLEFEKSIEQHGLTGTYFEYRINGTSNKKAAHFLGSFFIENNRFYTVSYTGQPNKHVEVFLSSFRLLQ